LPFPKISPVRTHLTSGFKLSSGRNKVQH
jgi:hypothetical protein